MCPHQRAHWCHLANTIELVLPSAHPSPQSKRQSVQSFLHSSRQKVPILYNGRPFPQNCPFSWGGLGPLSISWFLEPDPAHNPNCIMIASAIFAQVTAKCPYTLQWMPLPPKLPLPMGDLDPHVRHDSLDPSEPTNQTASLSVHSRFCTDNHSVPILYNGTPLPPSKLPIHMGGSGLPSNTWFPGPTRVLHPNGISIGSAVLAGLTSVTDRPTDHVTWSVTIDRIYVRNTAMRSNNSTLRDKQSCLLNRLLC